MPSGFADPPQRTQHSHPDEPRRRDSPPLVEAPSTEKNDLNSHSNSLELSGPTSITPTLESSEAETSTSVVKSTTPEAIDMETFHQILDLDEDDTHEFSRGMAWAYFSQVDNTFVEMDEALADKDLAKLSSLGHFLKGSSAALGVSKVQASCERIQHYGQLRDEDVGQDLTDKVALDKIERLLGEVKVEYAAAEKWLRNWYDPVGEKPAS